MDQHELPDDIAAFKAALRGSDVSISLDRPNRPDGEFIVDVSIDGEKHAVAWRADEGFGLHKDEEPTYGERPDEIVRDPAIAAARFDEIRASWKASSVPS